MGLEIDKSEVYAELNAPFVIQKMDPRAFDVCREALAKAWRAGHAAGVADATKIEVKEENVIAR